MQASIVVTVYELLKATAIDNIRSFLADGWAADGKPVESEEYQRDVRARSDYLIEGSLRWLVENQAITTADAGAMRRLRKARNRFAHQLGALVVDPSATVDVTLITDAIVVARNLSRFWGGIEVDTDPDFDGRQVDLDGIRSGTALLIEHLEIAFRLSDGLTQAAELDLADAPEAAE
jgi:hypothetical protein